MRVLILSSEAPPVTSGLAHVAGMMADGLERRGHVVDVVSAADYPRAVVGEYRFTGFVGGWRSLAEELTQYDVIAVHGPSPTFSDAFLGLFRTVPRRWRPPVVYAHHFDIDLAGIGPLCRGYNRLTRFLARSTDRVIVSTDSYADQWRRTSRDVSVVPWPLRRSTTAVDSGGGPAKSEPGPLRILFVGQMRSYKGLPTLLEAVGNDPRLALTAVGDGQELDSYRSLARRICPTATFPGRIDDEGLARMYAASHVIVLPSLRRVEAFGLVLLEGMAAGCVPVASDLPGVRDIAGPTGLVVPPGDVRALRSALLQLATDRGRLSELSDKSTAFVRTFTEDRFVHGVEQVLIDVVSAHRSRLVHRPLRPQRRVLRGPSLAKLGKEFNSSWASVVWLDEDSHQLHQAWGRAATITGRPPGVEIVRIVAQRNQATLVDELEMRSENARLLRRPDVGSAIAAPVRLRGLVGVVCLTRSASATSPYTSTDARRLGWRLRSPQATTAATAAETR